MKRLDRLLLMAGVAALLLIALMGRPGSAFAAGQADDPAPGSALAQSTCTYTVRRGDILSGIAVRYGTTYRVLAGLNRLANPNVIFAGTALSVPCAGTAPAGVCAYYVVRRGDYLKSIAARYATTWQAITRANHLTNPNRIYPGMRLAIPCGPAPAPDTAAWKSWTSTKHGYAIKYPADWKIDVQTGGGGHDPEYVYLRPPVGGLPQVQVLALKDKAPITGYENCEKNLQFRGLAACSISLPKGQNPATKLLIFQKGASHFQLAMEYDAQQQLAVFEEIVKSFQFTP
jgi:LysM repeat protein